MHFIWTFTLVLLASALGSIAREQVELGDGLRQDAEVLQAFRSSIENDPSGALRDWEVYLNPCRWYGVECAQVATSDQHLEDRVVSLELWGLELEGSISSRIGELSHLHKLAIVGSKFSGQIPLEIRNCKRLSTLDLRANELSGDLSFSLADLPRLQVLKLSENQLAGTISGLFAGRKHVKSFDPFHFREDRLCPRLQVFDVAQNSLSGTVPPALGGCTQLLEISLNDNSFSGPIPDGLSTLPHLHSLSLNNNRLEGSLPSSIAAGCKNLQFLNVADNLLDGNIPVEYAQFGGFRHFNFSNNRLEGQIPLGKWKVRQMALEGLFSSNPGLCGWPLAQMCHEPSERSDEYLSFQNPGSLVDQGVSYFARLCSRMKRLHKGLISVRESGKGRLVNFLQNRRSMAEAPATSSAGKKSNHTARKWALGLALGIVAGAVAAALLATILRLCVFYMHKAPYLQGPIIFHPNISPKMLVFLEKDESLSEAELVGEGGAGRVYKAHLENDMVVAVKSVVVKEDQKGLFGQRQIQAELETLGCIRHRNLVVLLAYVHKPDCHLLLYDYMQNGSLHHALQKINAGELEIPWPTRHKIALGTSHGLSYLHFHCNPKIVHRDLKPSNILLDANFVAHVSDFGLAKVIPGAHTHVTTGVAGTVGYIAPEYSQTCRFTDKSDVYSYGVVLSVLLTGKDPTDQFFHTVPGGSIGSWLHDLLQKGEGKDAIDRRLLNSGFEEEILLAMKIAVFCTNANAAERPSSKDVLVMLSQIRNEEP